MEYAPYLLKEHGYTERDFHKFINKHGYFIYDLGFNQISSVKIGSGSSTDVLLIKDKLI